MRGQGINLIHYSPEQEAEILRDLGFLMSEIDDVVETADLGLNDVPMNEINNVMPEPSDILEEQLQQVEEGRRKAMLVTNGARLPSPLPADISMMRVPQGYIYFNIHLIKPERVAQLATTNRLGMLLGDAKKGYGIMSRPDNEEGMVVSLRNRDGMVTDDVESNSKSLASVIDALSSLNDGTGNIEIRNAMDALRERHQRNVMSR